MRRSKSCIMTARSAIAIASNAASRMRQQQHFLSTHASHNIWRPKNMRMGWSPNVVESCLPLTSEIMTSRSKYFENIAVGYCHPTNSSTTTNTEATIPPKRIEDSWLEIILPFSDQPLLRQGMVRANGKSLLYGKLFEILDAFAADVAYRHCGGHKQYGTVHNFFILQNK